MALDGRQVVGARRRAAALRPRPGAGVVPGRVGQVGHLGRREAEAQAQAICMLTEDYTRAYNAFVAKQKPVFQGN